jgi:hypothetical protein
MNPYALLNSYEDLELIRNGKGIEYEIIDTIFNREFFFYKLTLVPFHIFGFS